jgi:hypothetical protein
VILGCPAKFMNHLQLCPCRILDSELLKQLHLLQIFFSFSAPLSNQVC